MNNSTIKHIGIGLGVLTIIFFVLKIFGVLDWSWAWVFAPIWIFVGTALIMIVTIVIISFIIMRKEDGEHK